MAVKTPLVLGTDGRPQQLQAGDTLAGVGGSAWTVATAAVNPMVAGTPYLAVITADTDFTLPAPTAGQTFSVSNSKDSTPGVKARVVVGGGRQINGLATGDNLYALPGETISLVARNTTDFDLVTAGAVGPIAQINAGVAEIDFGSFPGSSHASLVITGQPGIVAGSKVDAWVVATATVDHSADEHAVETLNVSAGDIVPGTGFTIYGVNTSTLFEPLTPGHHGNRGGMGTRLYGKFTVHWQWT